MEVKLNILISGMHCGHCVQAIEEAIASLPGVRTCAVEVGSASVSFDDSVADKKAFFAAIRRAGDYEVAGFSVA